MLDTAEVKQLDPYLMSAVDADKLWDRVRSNPFSFDDFSRDRGDLFAARLLAPTTALFEYKDAGLVIVDNIIPKLNAHLHFFLWVRDISDGEITAVGREVCRIAFERWNLHRITCFPPAFNKLAIRIATRVGFRYEGMVRQAFLYKGVYHDMEIRGLLEEEFRRIP